MKISHVVPHIDREASGPSYSVPRLCQAEAELGHQVELNCLAAASSIPSVCLNVYRQWPVLRRFAISHELVLALRDSTAYVDIVHNHSLWSMVNVASGWIVPGRKAKLVVSPRGTLSPWALNHGKGKKRLVWPIQRRALYSADMIHATSIEEYEQVRSIGITAPVAIIPNGIDVPDISTVRAPEHSKKTVLFLSRIHKTKGLEYLLQAWQSLESRHPEWSLVIAGDGDPDYEATLKNLAANLGLHKANFVGAVYGQDKSDLYRQADLFILPTHTENFGMVVAEALAHACPVIVSRGAPWSRVIDEECGWWIDNDVDSIVTALESAIQMNDESRKMMGVRGREWMLREFSWESIAIRMISAYQWLLTSGKSPDYIKVK